MTVPAAANAATGPGSDEEHSLAERNARADFGSSFRRRDTGVRRGCSPACRVNSFAVTVCSTARARARGLGHRRTGLGEDDAHGGWFGQVLGVFTWLLGKVVKGAVGGADDAESAGVVALGCGERGSREADRRWTRTTSSRACCSSALGIAGVGAWRRLWASGGRRVGHGRSKRNVTVTAATAYDADRRAPAIFLPVVVEFSTPVAPLSALGKPVMSGVAMSPTLEGTWRWRSDHELTFVPREGIDWPVGQKFSVHLARHGLVLERCEARQLCTRSRLPESALFTVREAQSEFYFKTSRSTRR